MSIEHVRQWFSDFLSSSGGGPVTIADLSGSSQVTIDFFQGIWQAVVLRLLELIRQWSGDY